MSESEATTKAKTVGVRLNFDILQNGKHAHYQEVTVQAPVLDDGSVDFQFELPHPEPTPPKQQGVTARWVGEEPLSVRCTADPERVAKALGDGEEIEMKTVELPVAAESKTGKEIVRAANGSIQAAIDTEFVELRWDLDRARWQEAAA